MRWPRETYDVDLMAERVAKVMHAEHGWGVNASPNLRMLLLLTVQSEARRRNREDGGERVTSFEIDKNNVYLYLMGKTGVAESTAKRRAREIVDAANTPKMLFIKTGLIDLLLEDVMRRETKDRDEAKTVAEIDKWARQYNADTAPDGQLWPTWNAWRMHVDQAKGHRGQAKGAPPHIARNQNAIAKGYEQAAAKSRDLMLHHAREMNRSR
jgi:hypothetical protein